MQRLIPLVEVYENDDTAFVRCGDIFPKMKSPWTYLQEQETSGLIKVQWTQHPKIKLTELGYETLRKMPNDQP